MEKELAEYDAREIAEVIETNDTEFCCHWAQAAEVELTREEYWYRLSSAISHPYFNSIFEATIPPDEISEAIQRALTYYRSKNLPMCWWVGPQSQPDDLGKLLVDRGLTHVATEVVMAMRPFEADYERVSDEVEVQAVTSATDLRTWVEVMTSVYDLPNFTQEPWFQILKKAGIGSRNKLQHFVALVDGEVAGVGSIFYGSQAAGIYNVAVLPPFRGQGVASTLTISLLSLIDEEGSSWATLCASQKAKSLYRRIGFRAYGDLSCYQWLPE